MSTIEVVVTYLKQTSHRIIGVDGDLGAGKTLVANRLAAALSLPCIHLDDFLAPRKHTFRAALDYQRLERKIDRCNSSVIIEGICLLAALARLHRHPDYLIFVEPESRFKAVPKSPILLGEVQA